MTGRQGALLVAGDYGDSDDDSDAESAQQEKQISKSGYSEGQGMNTSWSVLYDQATGYPYYWHPQTNEVRWDKPIELEQPSDYSHNRPSIDSIEEKELPTNLSHVNVGENLSESSSICISNEKVNKNKPNKSTGKLRSTKSSKTLGCRNTVFIGPSLPPEPKPEELAQQQAQNFEENLANTLISEIEDELPPDWNSSVLSNATKTESSLLINRTKTKHPTKVSGSLNSIYRTPFTWKKNELLIDKVNKMETKTKAAVTYGLESRSNHVALIAHCYGDEYESDIDDEEKCLETAEHDVQKHSSRKRKIELKVKSSKLAKEHTSRALRPAAAIFQESEYIKDEENCTEMQNKTCKKTDSNDERYHPEENFSPSDGYNDENSAHNIHSPRQQKVYKQEKQSASKDNKSFGDNTGPTYKKSIDNIAEMLCDKLEALEVHAIHISPLKLLAIKVETMFEAWHNGALSAGYMQKFLAKMQGDMAHLEAQELAPPGWRVIWNRYSG